MLWLEEEILRCIDNIKELTSISMSGLLMMASHRKQKQNKNRKGSLLNCHLCPTSDPVSQGTELNCTVLLVQCLNHLASPSPAFDRKKELKQHSVPSTSLHVHTVDILG